MIFSREENTVILTQERASIPQLVSKIEESYDKIKSDNVVINLSSLGDIPDGGVDEFLQVSNRHRKTKKSFVIVSSKVNLETISDKITVVPTLQEAYDLIEMEEMERDLGI
jgi:anti-anti-sigma regulatory factor